MGALAIIVEAYRRYYESVPTADVPTPAAPEEIESGRVIVVGSQPVRLDEPYLKLAGESDGIAADGAQAVPAGLACGEDQGAGKQDRSEWHFQLCNPFLPPSLRAARPAVAPNR